MANTASDTQAIDLTADEWNWQIDEAEHHGEVVATKARMFAGLAASRPAWME